MTTITLKGNTIHTNGSLPQVGSMAPDFHLTNSDLGDVSLKDFQNKTILLNIFPSLDTPTCSMSVKKFNEEASKHPNIAILCISMDLPFAQKRFCAAENIENVMTLSAFRNSNFGSENHYGVTIADGPLAGLFSRAIVVIGPDKKVLYQEQVSEITEEPNYKAALSAIL